MIFIPYSTTVVITRWPIGNIAIMGACVAMFVLSAMSAIPEPIIEAMILQGWNPTGLIGHQFLHAGIVHLFFNMLFLWVFGNAVCETMGNLRYLSAFVTAGVLAGIIHLLFDGHPAIGASGAINGIIGFYLVLYPINAVDCFYWVFIRAGSVEVKGYWLVSLWLLFDAWGAISGNDTGVAYWAHIGGLLSGIAMGVLFEKRGWARLADYDNPSLVDLLFRKRVISSMIRPIKTREELIAEHRAKTAEHLRAVTPGETSEMIDADCPHCQGAFMLSMTSIGATIRCPHCNGTINVSE